MAEGTDQKTAAAPVTPPKAEVVAAVSPVPEKPTTTADKITPPPAPVPEPEIPSAATPAAVEELVTENTTEATDEEKKITESTSFKEETNVAGELPDPQKVALDELKLLIQEALNKREFSTPPPPPPAKEEEKPAPEAAVPVETPAEEKPASSDDPKPEEKPVPVAETPVAAVPPPAAVEASKPDVVAPPPVEIKVAEKAVAPPAAPATVVEPSKAVAPPPVEIKIAEKAVVPPAAPVPVAEPSKIVDVVEAGVKVATVDEDGAKTVEAIKETILEVSAPVVPAAQVPKEVTPAEETPDLPPPTPEEVSFWGIPLLADEKSDAILLKFLRARDFKVKDAFTMIKNTARWQKEFGTEALIDEELGSELEKAVFMHGFDKEGHPICWNVYGEFQNKELYQNTFADEEKRQKFLRWRIQFLEKSIRNLDFSPDGVCSIVQVNDLKNAPGLFKRELRLATNQAVQLLQDNYPEFVAKQVFINVPWWYLAYNRVISPFFTQRTKSKFVFAGPSRSAETLFKYIAPEQVPVQYGGLSREGEQEFTTADSVTEDTIKPTSKHTIEFPITEKCVLVWEVRVVGWEVSYGAEFVPSAEDGYTVVVQKLRKISPADETIISNSFKIGEPGKVVLTFDNQTSKKKKVLCRSKTKPSE